jgi:hypothetical protein
MDTLQDGGPAFPVKELISHNGGSRGMSLRAYIATAALQGMVVNPNITTEQLAQYSVECADALIAELNKVTK